MKPLSPRERKLVAAGLLVAAIALVWLGMIQPILSGFTARAERREELAALYSRNERIIARIDTLRRAAEQQRQLQSAFAIAAPDAEQAGEQLKERLEAGLIKAGGELRSSTSVEAQPGWVRASVTGLVSNEQLVTWLGQLTNDVPYLSLESLTVGADRALNSNRLDLMDVNLEAAIPFGPAHAR